MDINGKKIDENNKSLKFPLYNVQIDMVEGENPINILPEKDFDFSTANNTFYGYVKVVSDISKIDIESIKSEVNKYVPTKQEIIDNSGLPSCH